MSDTEYQPDFVLTRELLREGLVPSGFSGCNTDKRLVPGFPEMLVRINRGESDERMQAANDSHRKLADYKINLINYVVITEMAEPHIVTQIVHGEKLIDAIENGQVSSEELEETWSALIDYHVKMFKDEEPIARDIVTTEQYMYGRLYNQPEDKIYPVDLSEFSGKYAQDNMTFCDNLVRLAEGIVEMEKAGDLSLENARLKLHGAMSELPRDFEYLADLHKLIDIILTEGSPGLAFDEFII
ncbi:MAG TPA: hypothetical protein VF401_04105 [Candidatus Saccharimonadales bacterium]